MKKIKVSVFTLLSIITVLYSCNKEEYAKDGDWDPMEWEPKHTVYDDAYTIPANGDTIVFFCKNYAPWISA